MREQSVPCRDCGESTFNDDQICKWCKSRRRADILHQGYCHTFVDTGPCTTDEYRHACGTCGGDKRLPKLVGEES